MIEDLKGHYHQLSFSNEGEVLYITINNHYYICSQPLMEDTLINEINDELSK